MRILILLFALSLVFCNSSFSQEVERKEDYFLDSVAATLKGKFKSAKEFRKRFFSGYENNISKVAIYSVCYPIVRVNHELTNGLVYEDTTAASEVAAYVWRRSKYFLTANNRIDSFFSAEKADRQKVARLMAVLEYLNKKYKNFPEPDFIKRLRPGATEKYVIYMFFVGSVSDKFGQKNLACPHRLSGYFSLSTLVVDTQLEEIIFFDKVSSDFCRFDLNTINHSVFQALEPFYYK